MSKRINYFDFLNVISCFSVICLHLNGIYHTYSHTTAWNLAAIIQAFFYFAVPIFFMLSGATLMEYNYKYSTTEFYKRRIKKTVIPYICFGVLFTILDIIKIYLKTGIVHISIYKILCSFLTGELPFTNYWFFIPLFLIYLFIPVFSKFVINSTKHFIEFVILILIFFESIYPIFEYFFDFPKIRVPISGYILFVILGYVLNKFDYEKSFKLMIFLLIMTITSIALRIFVMYKYCYFEIPIIQSYFGVYSIFPSIFIFLLAKKYVQESNYIFTFLSSLSFGVYLIQAFIIQIFMSVFKDYSFILQIIGPILVYITCVFIVFIIRKIKYLRWIFP